MEKPQNYDKSNILMKNHGTLKAFQRLPAGILSSLYEYKWYAKVKSKAYAFEIEKSLKSTLDAFLQLIKFEALW